MPHTAPALPRMRSWLFAAFRDLKRDDYTLLEPVDPDLETTSPPPVDGDGDRWDEDS